LVLLRLKAPARVDRVSRASKPSWTQQNHRMCGPTAGPRAFAARGPAPISPYTGQQRTAHSLSRICKQQNRGLTKHALISIVRTSFAPEAARCGSRLSQQREKKVAHRKKHKLPDQRPGRGICGVLATYSHTTQAADLRLCHTAALASPVRAPGPSAQRP
jgi:hypothetical protein